MRALAAILLAGVACVGCQTAQNAVRPCPPPEVIQVAVEHALPQPPPSARPDLMMFRLREDSSDDEVALAYASDILVLMNEVERLNHLLDGYRVTPPPF